MGVVNSRNFGEEETIEVTCTNTGKSIKAVVLQHGKDRLSVVLPGHQKLVMNRSPRHPALFVANQFGMEFTANVLPRNQPK